MSKGTLHDSKKLRTRDALESHAFQSLSARLVELGSTFALFGRYLATRIDALPAALCETLAEIPDIAIPMAPETARETFIEEIGCSPERTFQNFQSHPFESRLLWQAHRATLAGSQVVVKIMHLDVQTVTNGADFPATVSRLMDVHGVTASQLGDMVEDFRRELSISRTFEADLEASSLFEQDAQSCDVIGAPRPIAHLCGLQVAVYELSRTIADQTGIPDPDLARTLCFAWLHQALRGRVYPVDPRIENVAFSSEGRVLFAAGPFGTLSQRTKANLLSYLVAVATESTDEACTYLSQVHAAGRPSSVDEDLYRTFHQTVAFRDSLAMGRSSRRSAVEHRFADEVLIHWRLISERGRMEADLISFYRGLFVMLDTVRRIGPDRDFLAEALYDLRLAVLFGQAREMMQPSEFAGVVESYANAVLNMPQQIDRALANVQLQGRVSQSRNSRTALFSLLLALGAIAMLFHKINGSASRASPDRLLVFLFVGIGLILLWVGSKLT